MITAANQSEAKISGALFRGHLGARCLYHSVCSSETQARILQSTAKNKQPMRQRVFLRKHEYSAFGFCTVACGTDDVSHFPFFNIFDNLALSQTPQASLFKVQYWYWPASGVIWLLGNRSDFRAWYDCDDRGVRRDRQEDCPHTHTQSDLCVCATFRKRGLGGAICKLLWAAVPLNHTTVGGIDTGTLEQLYLRTSKCPSYLHHIWHLHLKVWTDRGTEER